MKWYALFVETGQEDLFRKYVDVLLPSEPIEILIPKRRLIERRQGKYYEKIRKLFPGYVLAKTEMDYDIYYKIKAIPHLFYVLKDGHVPVPIRDEEMEVILRLTRDGEIIEFSQIYREGKKIKVCSGPLEGMEGIIEKFDARKKRVKVRIEFLGKIRRVDLGAHLVMECSEGKLCPSL